MARITERQQQEIKEIILDSYYLGEIDDIEDKSNLFDDLGFDDLDFVELVIDLEMLDGIEIKGSTPKTMTFLSSLIMESKKHIFINSNFDDTEDPKKYKVWFNTEDPDTKERINNEDLEKYAELQYDLERKSITDFSYKGCSCSNCGGTDASGSKVG